MSKEKQKQEISTSSTIMTMVGMFCVLMLIVNIIYIIYDNDTMLYDILTMFLIVLSLIPVISIIGGIRILYLKREK